MKTRFKGHETFYFREGWLSKAISEIDMHPESTILTNTAEGIAKLGVGANMVKSIKYWIITSHLVKYEKRRRQYVLTEIGNIITAHDIYLEDSFTLWLIHLEILNNQERATTWYLFWNEFKADNFNSKDVLSVLKSTLDEKKWPYNQNSLENDINVLLSMYSKKTFDDPEENAMCPLAQLDLFDLEDGMYIRKTPNINELHELIVYYAIIKLCERNNNVYHLQISEIEESLATSMNINRIIVNDYLDRLARKDYVKVDRTSGLNILYVNTIPLYDLIEDYYEERGDNI